MDVGIYHESQDDVFNLLVDGVRKFNFEVIGEEIFMPLMMALRDDSSKIIGDFDRGALGTRR
ncbi:hypothetical protein D3C75_1243030 [compost metagenome]